MDRCALFVDANYALAEGALVVHGTRNRDSVSWNYAGLLKLLSSLSRDRTGLPLLRCYWYDTAADDARAAEHDALADVPGVKLRLSKARPSRKEGVEAEIRKDLTTLARNHAVSDVVIVSAEEDLAPVISEVQDLGIKTVLFHVATGNDWAISRTLRQECDDIIEIGAAHLQPYVDLIAGAEPQLPAGGFRELAGAAVQSSGQHPAIEAPAARLYGTPLTAEYEHAALAGAGHLHANRQEAPPFGGAGEALHTGPIAGSGDSQPGLPGTHHLQGTGSVQGQPVAHLQVAQPAATQLAQGGVAQGGYPAQAPLPQGPQSPGLERPSHQGQSLQGQSLQGQALQPTALAGQAQQYQRSDPGRGHQPVGAESGLDPAGYGGRDIRSPLNQASPLLGGDFDARHAHDDGRGRPGSGGQPGHEGLNGAGQNGQGSSRLGHGQQGQNQQGQNPQGQNQLGQPQFGQPPFGQTQASQSYHVDAPGAGASGAGHQLPDGFGGPQSGPRAQPAGQAGVTLPAGGQPASGMPGRHGGQGNGMHAGALQPHDLSPNGAHPANGPSANGLSANGLPANGLPPGPGALSGQPLRGAAPQPGGSPGGPQGYGQPAPGQPGAPAAQRPGGQGAAMPAAAVPPDGLMPLDGRQPLPQRQLPPANGMPYSQDRSMPYGGSSQPAQLTGTAGTAAYGQNSYGSQPSAPASVALPVGDAVQSAHTEGFGFGEAVARDAPALWLEAVLARKPRMPSDLEARLLQGSALPIDSLLHDEVRHALRRGFWDALERSRH